MEKARYKLLIIIIIMIAIPWLIVSLKRKYLK